MWDSAQATKGHFIKTLHQGTNDTISGAVTHVRAPVVKELPLGSIPAYDPTVRAKQARAIVEACERELALSPKPSRAGRLHFECARLYESPIGDFGSAATHYRKAHALMPDHVPSMQGARRALIAQKDFAAALPLFDAEVKHTTDPRRKAIILNEKGRLLEDALGQKREAREAYSNALELDESNPVLLKSVERAELSAKAWEAVARTYERAANSVQSDPRHRAAVIAERARIAEARLKDSSFATELYQAALESDVNAPSAISALKRLHYTHQRWKDLIVVLEREAEQASDPEVRAMALYRVGKVYAERLGSLDHATAALERAVTHAPNDPLILEELARLYEQGKRYEQLSQVLERLAERLTTPEEKVGFYHRTGQLYEEQSKDEAKAIAWYERALGCDRGYVPALQALAKLYTHREKWAELVAMHAGEAETVRDPERRASAYSRIAAICEDKLRSPEQAAQYHARALGIVPGYQPAFKALVRLYSQAGKFADLAELYERAIDWAEDSETKITYLFKVGRIHEDALAAPTSALGAYKRILAIDPQHLGAIHALERAAERGRNFDELVAALELEAQKVSDKKQKLSLMHRAGEVSELELGDDNAALSYYRKVIEIDKNYAPALSSVGRLYYKAGRWEDLLETYQAELRALPKGPSAAALLFKMGELYEERLARDEDAIASYRKAIELDPTHQPALNALARKLTEGSRWDDLVKLLEVELGTQKEPSFRARTAFRLGQVYEDRLRAPEKALAAYEQALQAEPDFRPARDGRARLLTEARDFKRLVEELDHEVQNAKDPRLVLSALLRQGEIYRDELGDAARAVVCFEAVLERDPAHIDALLALEPMYAERGAYEKLALVYSTEARVFVDVGARVAALRELARLQEQKGLGTPEDVKATYFSILQLAPADVSALFALERIALETGDSKLLAHIDAKLASLTDEAGLSAAYHVRLGEALEEFGDASALDVYRAALGRDPESIGAARGIARIAEQSSDPRLLEEAAEWQSRVSREPELSSRLLVRAANLYTERGEIEPAIRILLRALEQNPEYEPAALRIRELLLARGDVERLIGVLTQAANAAHRKERIAELWINIAELYADRKQDVPAALAALHRAEGLLPGYVPMLMKMGELYARDSQWSQAVDRWNHVIAAAAPDDIKVEAHLSLAAVLHEKLNDPARALTNLSAVLTMDPNHRAALERLLHLQESRGQVDAAADTAAKLVRVSPEAQQRVTALTLLARLERKRGQPAAAMQAYEQAVQLVGMAGTPATEFRDLVSELARKRDSSGWPRYVNALSRYAEQTRGGGPAVAAVYLEMARALADQMGQGEQAILALQRGIGASGENVELVSELGARLIKAGQHQQAIAAFRRVLEFDVNRADAWRQLSEAYRLLQRPSESTLSLAPLVAIGAANDLERATLSVRPIRPATAAPGSFGLAELQAISWLSADDPASRLLSALADGLGKLHPPELERYGLTTRDRIGAKSGHPLRALADKVASIFALTEYDLYMHRAHSGLVEIEFTDPVAIMLPAYFANLTESQQVFLLGRAMANIVRRLHAVDKLTPDQIALVLAGAARSADPSFGAGMGDEDFLNAHSKRVMKSLPWLGRGGVEDAARDYAAAARIDTADWVSKVKMTSARAALVVSDDLAGSVIAVRQKEGDLAGASGPINAYGMRMVDDMLRFWVSDAGFALRHRLGMSA